MERHERSLNRCPKCGAQPTSYRGHRNGDMFRCQLQHVWYVLSYSIPIYEGCTSSTVSDEKPIGGYRSKPCSLPRRPLTGAQRKAARLLASFNGMDMGSDLRVRAAEEVVRKDARRARRVVSKLPR